MAYSQHSPCRARHRVALVTVKNRVKSRAGHHDGTACRRPQRGPPALPESNPEQSQTVKALPRSLLWAQRPLNTLSPILMVQQVQSNSLEPAIPGSAIPESVIPDATVLGWPTCGKVASAVESAACQYLPASYIRLKKLVWVCKNLLSFNYDEVLSYVCDARYPDPFHRQFLR